MHEVKGKSERRKYGFRVYLEKIDNQSRLKTSGAPSQEPTVSQLSGSFSGVKFAVLLQAAPIRSGKVVTL